MIFNYRLKLSDSSQHQQDLVGYAEANWAEDRDSRKSNTGNIFKLLGGNISWVSKKQKCISVSSTKSEIVALSESSRECTWLRKLLEFFDEKQNYPTIIDEDNIECINNMHTNNQSP